ncbi:helix-turn-helix domain-containing protein [Denitratisoma sp. DHT3]|uniref:helix-turn-helix domain-containing protein n=1 Tax=Denitratisoma sp. DHT3 TaxID=1981880 RepID=UPI00164834E2|nr:helix-turn-helix domain-containing protein [Denitratisoma sp. DHT3]
MGLLLTTDAIAVDDRVDWWQERTAEIFGAEYAITPDRHQAFSLDMEAETAHGVPLVLLKGSGSAHLATRREGADGACNIAVHLQIQGHYTAYSEDRETHVKPGDLFIHRIGPPSTIQFHENYQEVCVILPESMLDPSRRDRTPFSDVAIPATSGTAAVLADYLRSLAAHAAVLNEPDSAADLSSFTTSLLNATLRSSSGASTPPPSGLRSYHLSSIKRFAITHLNLPSLNVDFIAAGVNLSARYIHRLFEDEPQSLMRWVMKERLERAYNQLRQADCRLSICKIAYAWGFSDHAHFSRSFQKYFGISPREARMGEPRTP